MLNFSLNHVTLAKASYQTLLSTASACGCSGVEIRNDLGGELFDGKDAVAGGVMAREHGLRLHAVAEVKAFNDFSDEKKLQAQDLMRIARDCGAEAVSLIPRNGGPAVSKIDRMRNLRIAVEELKPLLESQQLVGLIEPLGFIESTLRHKAEVVEVLEDLNACGCFKLVHDTFHHHLAGDSEIFPEHTGIIHISGVNDVTLTADEMRDEHRFLVSADDQLQNIEQLAAFTAAGFKGPVSVEAFAPDVHAMTTPEVQLNESFSYINAGIAAVAA